jgi:membrane-associated protein
MDWDTIWDWLLHLDRHLNDAAVQMGPWFYVLIFAVVFVETGLVILPFLPGDSLLFIVGALAAKGDINVLLAGVLLSIAAVAGDALNYAIGRAIGPRVFHSETSRLLNKKHLLKAQAFYEKYGAKTIVIARFVPIVRTFAPFVAGIGRMEYRRFAFYNVAGGLFWVWSLLLAGYFFGRLPWVQRNHSAVTLGIIVVSVLPIAIEWWRARAAKRATPPV